MIRAILKDEIGFEFGFERSLVPHSVVLNQMWPTTKSILNSIIQDIKLTQNVTERLPPINYFKGMWIYRRGWCFEIV